MAIAVVGGLFMSTLLTLVVVPVVFTYMDDLQNWIFKVFKSRHQDDQSPNITMNPMTTMTEHAETGDMASPKLINKTK
jgi:hypothetical protein